MGEQGEPINSGITVDEAIILIVSLEEIDF